MCAVSLFFLPTGERGNCAASQMTARSFSLPAKSAPFQRGAEEMRCAESAKPALFRADAALRRWFSYVRELSAGAAKVPAGYSPGTGDSARGGTAKGNSEFGIGARGMGASGDEVLSRRFALSSCLALHFCHSVLPSAYARPRISVAAFCPQFMPSFAFLSRRFAFGICSTSHFCRGVLPSAYARPRISVAAFCLRFTPAVCRMATNRTACDTLRFYSAGSRSPFVRSRNVGAVICLGAFTSGLAVYFWRSRRVTGDAGTGDGAGGACALLRGHIGSEMLSAGSTLGLRAPDCAKESSTLWTLLTLRRG